jgi:hypothetical protein
MPDRACSAAWDYDAESETIDVVQVILWEGASRSSAGEFDYHGEHQHVHWDAFAVPRSGQRRWNPD